MSDISDEQLQQNTAVLSNAIEKYAAENMAKEGTLLTWVIMVGHAKYDDEGGIWYSSAHAIDPTSNLFSAHGVVQIEAERLRKYMLADD